MCFLVANNDWLHGLWIENESVFSSVLGKLCHRFCVICIWSFHGKDQQQSQVTMRRAGSFRATAAEGHAAVLPG